MVLKMISKVRETSYEAYNDINSDGTYDTRMTEIFEIVNQFPLRTGKEYMQILDYNDPNIVRPRITDLKNLGLIVEASKRKCSVTNKEAYVWCTKSFFEQIFLSELGFRETHKKGLWMYKEDNILFFQDFRSGKRRSYAKNGLINYDYKTLEIYKKFKLKVEKASIYQEK